MGETKLNRNLCERKNKADIKGELLITKNFEYRMSQ